MKFPVFEFFNVGSGTNGVSCPMTDFKTISSA